MLLFFISVEVEVVAFDTVIVVDVVLGVLVVKMAVLVILVVVDVVAFDTVVVIDVVFRVFKVSVTLFVVVFIVEIVAFCESPSFPINLVDMT